MLQKITRAQQALLWLNARRVSADTQVTTLRKAIVVAFPPHAAAGVTAN